MRGQLMLTEKQDRVLRFIKGYFEQFQRSPTQEEIKQHFGFQAISTVQDYLKALEKKGAITRQAGKWSSIALASQDVVLMGKVAAGRPLEYIQHGEKIEVPPSMLKSGGRHFALQVVGDSMIGEGILEDDYVIIRSQSVAENGQIVVAMVESEATIKRFYKKRTHVELHSANPAYSPIIVQPSQRFEVAGIFCGLLRMAQQ
jgi:repressor LexA